jgi:hypothetical protein
MVERIPLPTGMSWHPSRATPERIRAFVAKPGGQNECVSNYKTITGLDDDGILRLIDELDEWRNELGCQWWPNWPDVDRARPATLLQGLPLGVSCVKQLVIQPKRRPRTVVVVTAYWQDYSKPRKATGGFPQANRRWWLPESSSYQKIITQVRIAHAYRQVQLIRYPRPARNKLYQR